MGRGEGERGEGCGWRWVKRRVRMRLGEREGEDDLVEGWVRRRISEMKREGVER